MKKYTALLALSLLSSPAWACMSYEECLNDEVVITTSSDGWDEYRLLRAIAYKLDEISQNQSKLTDIMLAKSMFPSGATVTLQQKDDSCCTDYGVGPVCFTPCPKASTSTP